MRCEKNREIKCLRSNEAICSLKGRFYEVQKSIQRVLEKLKKYAESAEKDFNKEDLIMLINSQFVTKIIGMGGSHIKQL